VTETPRLEAAGPSPDDGELTWLASDGQEGAFRDLLEGAPDAIVIVGGDGRILLANGQAEALFGYRQEELLGRPVEVLIPSRFRERRLAHRAGYLADARTRPMGSGLELYARRKNRREFPAEISLSSIRTRSGLLVMAALRDVSERQQAEAERARLLREAWIAQARFRSLFDAAADAIQVLDRAARCQDANPAAGALLCYAEPELVGMPLADLVPEGAAWAEAEFGRLVREGAWRGEHEMLRKGGEPVPVESRAAAVELPDGLAYRLALRDISERRLLERLQREFIAMINHDLLNPVTAIGLHAELL
jgi:PAS domain S-box-containing protein